MLIRDAEWSKVREQFSEEEKVKLREMVTGEAICPRGFTINKSGLSSELLSKLAEALKGVR